MKKKVLSIVPYPYLPYFSGGQKLIAHFNEFLGQECELHSAGTSDNDAALAKNYTFYPLLNKSRLRYINIFLAFTLQSLIKKKQIQTVIIEHTYYGWLGWLLKKLCRIQLVVHTHNIESQRFRTIGKSWWKLLEVYEKWILKNADLILCISEEDRNWMIDEMKIDAAKCLLVPYGIIQQKPPADKIICKEKVCQKHKLDATAPLLFFNGLLDYKPNLDALKAIIEKINPLLLQAGITYNILIAGKRLPAELNELKAYNGQHIFYAGFVDDIDAYTKAADVFLNPVLTGGGVKTKMIEALGLNTTVVATESGAAGVDKSVCGIQLKTVKDDDWKHFAEAVVKTIQQPKAETPPAFYELYYWGNVVKKVAASLAH
jgi:glycosyltransferase involved in cell wall biosynthesis